MIDEKAPGVPGGDFIEGDWRVREFTAAPNNDFARIRLGPNTNFELPAGEYFISASVPASNVNEHQARLADVTSRSDQFYPNGALVIGGTSEFAADVGKWRDSAGFYMLAATSTQTRSFVEGRFTVSRSTTLELQHRCAVSKGADGFGVDVGFYSTVPANNIFSYVNLWLIRGPADGSTSGFYPGTIPPPSVPPVSSFSGVFDSSSASRLATTSPFLRDFNIPNASTEALTMSVWARRDTSSIQVQNLFDFGRGTPPAPDENIFAMFHAAVGDGNRLAARIFADATPNGQKLYRATTLPAVGEWFMFTATYDGTNNADAFKLYLNGVEDTTPTKDVDTILSPITQINCPGSIGAGSGGGLGADHTIFSVTLWDKDLSAEEITAMYNSGDGSTFDILTDSGDYAASAEVVSWWLPGKDLTPNIGKDYGPNANDLTFENNVTRTTDVPDGT